jgi:dienelactone hydrolase
MRHGLNIAGGLALVVALHFADSSALAQAPRATDSDHPEPLLCRPTGQGPFAVVIWNHGLVSDRSTFTKAHRGWKNLCEAFAADGYLAYIPIRPFAANLGPAEIVREADELAKVVTRVIAMPDADPTRIALMGHSRGGILALMVAVKRKDLAAVVLTAPARIPPRFLGDTLERVRSLQNPVLLMVENGDEFGGVAAVREIDAELQRRAKDDHRTIRYDRGGGHFLFVRKDYWWDDLMNFLDEKLRKP